MIADQLEQKAKNNGAKINLYHDIPLRADVLLILYGDLLYKPNHLLFLLQRQNLTLTCRSKFQFLKQTLGGGHLEIILVIFQLLSY